MRSFYQKMKDEKINKLFTSENLNEKIESKNRKILFLVDNCPAHKVTFLYSHIKIVFFATKHYKYLSTPGFRNHKIFKCKFGKKIDWACNTHDR